ncbi:putative phage tail protein [Metabacillus fastidiosus]|uniref:putative phage tail protein n=1 Tax=Metabacillus fastidiosus TaxID=1458 RepID=UPI003D2A3BAC
MIAAIEERLESVLETVPDYYYSARVYKNILLASLEKYHELDEQLRDLQLQLYVPTATWGLDYWEYDYDIKPDPGDSYEIRRARILAKMAGLGTFTKAEALRLANVYSEPKDARFFSILNEGAFKTRHNVDHLIDFKGLVAAFEEMKPAHLQHIIGLLIRLAAGPRMTTKSRLRILQKNSFGPKHTKKIRMKIRLSYIVPGSFEPGTAEGLYWDGSFYMNDYAVLNGKAPGGKGHYLKQTESLTIRTYKNGMITETVTV